MTYSIKKQVQTTIEVAITRTKEALKKEGFGILTEIDVSKTLKEKLNVNYENYVILGACNPPFAFEALKSEKEIGLLLPCNLIVFEENGKVYVSAIKPSSAMSMIKNNKIATIAQEVEAKLKKVIDAI